MITNLSRRRLGMRPYVQGTDASALLGVRLETDKTAGRMYAAYPNLANVRWLLPANQPALRRAGIEGLYQPSSLRGRALRTIIGAGAVQGEKVWLEEDNLQRLETMLIEPGFVTRRLPLRKGASFVSSLHIVLGRGATHGESAAGLALLLTLLHRVN